MSSVFCCIKGKIVRFQEDGRFAVLQTESGEEALLDITTDEASILSLSVGDRIEIEDTHFFVENGRIITVLGNHTEETFLWLNGFRVKVAGGEEPKRILLLSETTREDAKTIRVNTVVWDITSCPNESIERCRKHVQRNKEILEDKSSDWGLDVYDYSDEKEWAERFIESICL